LHAATDAVAVRDAWSNGAETFLHGYLARHGAAGNESLAARRVIQDEIGQIHVRVTENIAGLPVVGAEMIVHADAKSGKVIGVNGRFAPDGDLPRRAQVNANAAIEFAAGEYGIEAGQFAGVPELTYIIADDGDDIRLAWTNLVSYRDEDGEELDRIFADALTGAAIARHPQIYRAKYREVYTCNNGTSVPGTLLFSEGGSSGDPTAMCAYINLGIAYDYFKKKHGRDSYNNGGATITSIVHYDNNLNNAFWLYPYLHCGDGDGVHFSPFACSLDVMAHEFTHAVTQNTAGLSGFEPGALNESFSDCFGAATEAYSDGSVNGDVWKIGDEVYTPGISGDAIRYLNDPTADGSSRDYYPARYTSGDHAHDNSGIQNLAFYLLVQGGQHPRGQTNFYVTAIGMSATEKIFYRALDVYATSSTNFRLIRDYTRQAAADLYGTNSTQHTAVWNAWAAVGNNWFQDIIPIYTEGDAAIGEPYTTITGNLHTGYLFGPNPSNFDLYLEKWNGSTWPVVASSTGAGRNETVVYNGAAGQYRWRVQSVTGTGTYNLYSNRPK
jgi:vibriolysin